MTKNNIDEVIRNNNIEYRQLLTIPPTVNFGLELELENINYDYLKRVLEKNFKNFKLKKDLSLIYTPNGEITTPVLTNRKETWIKLKKLAEQIQKLSPTYDNCSFQINYDLDLFKMMRIYITF